eukprot:NODE_339_length_2070_cov_71.619146_g333_i0.p1 GENE.NODE_339_length_2070_cov_71.619146_g333_i0~~NODE_339_length_2070_cov_71.619146_g333_i0.p1  ORF type:complete len:664 (-),score=147.25 NODE_339_length_2070_cov_71.619146_g333_i0:79-2010(-)
MEETYQLIFTACQQMGVEHPCMIAMGLGGALPNEMSPETKREVRKVYACAQLHVLEMYDFGFEAYIVNPGELPQDENSVMRKLLDEGSYNPRCPIVLHACDARTVCMELATNEPTSPFGTALLCPCAPSALTQGLLGQWWEFGYESAYLSQEHVAATSTMLLGHSSINDVWVEPYRMHSSATKTQLEQDDHDCVEGLQSFLETLCRSDSSPWTADQVKELLDGMQHFLGNQRSNPAAAWPNLSTTEEAADAYRAAIWVCTKQPAQQHRLPRWTAKEMDSDVVARTFSGKDVELLEQLRSTRMVPPMSHDDLLPSFKRNLSRRLYNAVFCDTLLGLDSTQEEKLEEWLRQMDLVPVLGRTDRPRWLSDVKKTDGEQAQLDILLQLRQYRVVHLEALRATSPLSEENPPETPPAAASKEAALVNMTTDRITFVKTSQTRTRTYKLHREAPAQQIEREMSMAAWAHDVQRWKYLSGVIHRALRSLRHFKSKKQPKQLYRGVARDLVENYPLGRTVEWIAHSTATSDRKKAESYARGPDVPEAVLFVFENSLSPCDITQWSANSLAQHHQHHDAATDCSGNCEWMIPAGCRFYVQSVKSETPRPDTKTRITVITLIETDGTTDTDPTLLCVRSNAPSAVTQPASEGT